MKDARLDLKQGALASGEVLELIDRPEARGVVGGVEVRVSGGVPGDQGTFRVVHTGKNATWVRPEALEQPSPDRVEAPCPVVQRCGGCPWQATGLEAQRRARRAILTHAIGQERAEAIADWAGPAATTGYRTRALMMLRHRHGKLRAGFYAPRSNDLVPAERCAVQHPEVTRVIEAATRILAASGLPSWRSAERPGVLRALLYRIDPALGEGLLTLIVHAAEDRVVGVCEQLYEIDGVRGVFLNVNDAAGGRVLGPASRLIAGAPRQEIRLGDLGLAVGPAAFVQTNHAVGAALLEVVRELAGEARADHLVDAYAGVGVFGLALADRARRVTLIESDLAAVADANYNVARLELGHVAVYPADTSVALPRLVSGGQTPDLVVLDPPRSGLKAPVVDALAQLAEGARVLYVSCSPRSLGRDLGRLEASGFELDRVVPLDMFPHTPHLEAVVRLTRRSNALVASTESG